MQTPEIEINILRQKVLDLSDRLDSLEKVRDQEVEQIPPLEDDPGVPRVGNLQLLSYTGTNQLDEVIIGFEEPRDHPAATNVEAYELYMKGTTSLASEFAMVSEVTRSPIVIPISSNVSGVITVAVRTRMKGGLGTPVETSPAMSIDVTALSNAIAAGSITTTELADGAVTNSKIANAAISTAKIQNAAITNALIANATIDQAKIVSVSAISIQAGTINSVNINAGTYTLVSGTQQMLINGASGFLQVDTLGATRAQIIQGSFRAQNSLGSTRASLNASTSGNYGECVVYNTGGTVVGRFNGAGFGGGANSGSTALYNSSGSLRVNIGTDSSDRGIVGLAGGTTSATLQSGSSTTAGLYFGGTKVVGVRGSTIADPTGGGTQDTQARTAIATIIDRLQAHGLIS